tara:strand:- start:645 stop:1001 length:357 start_codon:yes stop_codon:yes gene_type:complete
MEPGERSSLEDTIIEKISSSPYIQGELHTHICHKEYPCTNNENGIFLNVTALSDEHLIEINNVITHIEEYNQTFVDKELQLKELTETTVEKPKDIQKKQYKPFSLTPFQRRILNLISS